MRSIALADPDPQRLRERVLADFHASFDRYESLFEVLQGEQAFTVKPIALRHPLIFYLGHTATFFINKLVLAGVLQQRIDPRLESMFAVGVDEMSWDDLDEAHYDWPSSAQVRAYRDRVRQSVDRLIRELPLSSPIAWDSPWWVILMGIEHERIHLETSSVLIRQHRLEFVRPHPHWQPCPERGEPPANELVPVAAASFRLGRDRADPGYYGWDNEFGEHVANTAAFQAARRLVSNREFLEFVQAGGYADDSLWSEEGAAWKAFARAEHPSFWLREGAHWKLRLMCEVADMPWNWPVETNFHEAQAFCNWKARRDGLPVRLPSEDEWHALRRAAGIGDGPQPRPAAANFELDHWASSCPVDRFAHGPFFDVVGNAWQWLDTPTYPFPGFQVHPIYDDFTTPTFDERHNLIKGGSWVSCGNQALPVSRYAFRRHFFQHAGFRYVVGERPEPPEGSMYETDALVSQYCEFHWGAEPFGVPNFPRALAEIAVRAMQGRPMRRALDLGCATGRASFELARHFEHVVGIDFSARFIGVGTQLAEQGRIRYQLPDEGELVSYHERSLREYGLQDLAGKVEFVQGDACNLKPTVRDFDLVLAANLIDRLYSPARFLREVHRRIVSGGMLVITSPYTWLEEHTRREEWVGGFKKDGENFSTLDGLEQMLGEHFERVGEPLQVPFVIRETRRKFQHTVSELTVWRRR
ncbi:MAG: 5-histidylcysteine sulfoxide synthase [Betaproteobacteria bacterium]|nr:5-histidylcysteine sulfoxide synthase [Betaproteobacteria bacterium]MBU6511662.1 5-histidylcysteine sulfoxide synthase [Betaproteobacteria bacterium]MDE2480206.1 5-histidylcysteine sulfoxide synthase [Betaproteobacteria bacterium]